MPPPCQKPHRSKQDYRTPKNFLDAARARLGIQEFAFDFAADQQNTVVPGKFFDQTDDALSWPHWENFCADSSRLSAKWGWLNPPFTDIAPWAERCMETGRANGRMAFLVPAAVGSNWFSDFVDGEAFILLLNGRIHFMEDQPTWGYPKDCMLCLYGPATEPLRPKTGYEVWRWR